MSEGLLKVAQDEEARLIAELDAHPAYQRLRAVQHLISTYKALSISDQLPRTSNLPWPTEARSKQPSQASQIIESAAKFLDLVKRRAQVSEILEAIRSDGVQVDHANPIAYVSGVLSHSPKFDNVRGKGYGLVQWLTTDLRAKSVVTVSLDHEQAAVDALDEMLT